MSRRLLELPIVIVLALIALLAALLGWETLLPVRLVALPLMLVLPGYALVDALFDTSIIDLPERLLFSVGLSFVISILGGSLLHWSPWGLQAQALLLLLGGITLLSSFAALARRRYRPSEPLPGIQLALGRRQFMLFGLAAVITLCAITVARIGATRQEQATGRAQLWILPASTIEAGARLGIDNLETNPISYTLQLTLNGTLLQEWPMIELDPGQSWEQDVTLGTAKPGDTVEAFLYRTSEPGLIFRRVIFRPVDQP